MGTAGEEGRGPVKNGCLSETMEEGEGELLLSLQVAAREKSQRGGNFLIRRAGGETGTATE